MNFADAVQRSVQPVLPGYMKKFFLLIAKMYKQKKLAPRPGLEPGT